MVPHSLVRILLELLKDALGFALGEIGQVPDRLRTLVVVLGFEGLAGESLELSIKGSVISQGSQAAHKAVALIARVFVVDFP